MSGEHRRDDYAITFTHDEFILLYCLLHYIALHMTEEREGVMKSACTVHLFETSYGIFKGLMGRLHAAHISRALGEEVHWEDAS